MGRQRRGRSFAETVAHVAVGKQIARRGRITCEPTPPDEMVSTSKTRGTQITRDGPGMLPSAFLLLQPDRVPVQTGWNRNAGSRKDGRSNIIDRVTIQ